MTCSLSVEGLLVWLCIMNLKEYSHDCICTGTGIALDAASRGLKVALVERDDFAAGMIMTDHVHLHIITYSKERVADPQN